MECVSGSRAYGLDTPDSDTDIRGVFVMPEKLFFGLENTYQVSNPSNDIVFYEVGRFIELLAKNNPNILELLSTPDECIVFKHPMIGLIKPEDFLSKRCADTFGNYALSQIHKARGLNKKIVNPHSEIRKSIIDFCYIHADQGSVTLNRFLSEKGISQEQCGLVKIPNMQNMYGLFYGGNDDYSGVLRKENANDVSLSSVKPDAKPCALLFFNKDGYSKYCKEYNEYWEWVDKRNEVRYKSTMNHGKNYDAKNLMHTFRLLHMAEEIALEGKIYVKRKDREYLLKIKSGYFEYDDLLKMAEDKMKCIQELFSKSVLPDQPDMDKVNELIYAIRKSAYSGKF